MVDSCLHVSLLLLSEDEVSLDPNTGLCISKSLPVEASDPSGLIQGVLICIAGLGLLVKSDTVTDKNWPASNRKKGDAFMILGATLYGICKLQS